MSQEQSQLEEQKLNDREVFATIGEMYMRINLLVKENTRLKTEVEALKRRVKDNG